jgi:DNA-binding SARP family transcriptional activator/DNA-binding beta-propeller fold protein YncE
MGGGTVSARAVIEFRLLGPFEVYRDGEPLDLGLGKERALLALLLTQPNTTVTQARLVDQLWYDPPASATKILQNCVVKLRRLLDDGMLVTRARGYALLLDLDRLDVARFVDRLAQGRAALGQGHASAAKEVLEAALAEWRGEPLLDVGDAPFAHAEIRRLGTLRLDAVAELIAARLDLGEHDELVSELEQLVTEQSLNERLRSQLMVALYRSGRQADALQVYRDGRRALVGELGVEPGRPLRELEQAILRQDRALDSPPATTPGSESLSRRAVAIAVAVLLAAAAAGSSFALVRGASNAHVPMAHPPDDVAVIDQTGRITARVQVGFAPTSLAYDGRTVWVLNQADGTVTPIEARGAHATRPSVAIVGGGSGLTAIAVASKTLWVADSVSGTVIPVWPRGEGHVGPGPAVSLGTAPNYGYLTLASARGRLWIVVSQLSSVFAFDTATERVVDRTPIPGRAIAAAVGTGRVWCIAATDRSSGYLFAIDPRSGRITGRIPLPAVPTAVSVAFGAVWVALGSQGLIIEVAPQTGAVRRTINIGGSPIAIAAFARSLWVALASDQMLARIDPKTGDIKQTLQVAGSPHALLAVADRLWALGA